MAEEDTQAGQPGQATRWSKVYDHFTDFIDAQGKDKVKCKRCRLVFSGNTKSGTSNLWRHLKKCKGRVGESTSSSSLPQPQPSGPAGESSAGPGGESSAPEPAGPEEEASMDLARMIALHGYDPSVVEDDYFRSFVRRLNPGFEVPSRLSIDEMCDGIFDEKRKDLFSRLSDVQRRGKVSLAVGRTKSIIDGEILYTTCHFIDDEWNLHKMVMNVYVLTTAYFDRRGPLLGVPVIELDDELDPITDCIIDIRDDLKGRGIIDTLFMMAWDETVDVPSGIIDTYAKDIGFVSDDFMDNLLHSIAENFAPNVYHQMGYFHQVDDMNLTRQKRQRYLSQLDLDNLWEYDRSWFSLYCSLRVLHEGGQSISAGKCRSWTQLFFKLLREMYHAIQRVSASSGPTSNLCIVELFNIREVLQSFGDHAHDGCNVFVGTNLRHAKNKLDKVIQGSYLTWCIPLVLDPRYKLTYVKFIFERAFESDAANYISEVTRKLEELYMDYIQDGGTAVMVATSTSSAYPPLQQAWDELRQTEATRTELDRYMNDSVIPPAQDFDILKWWKDNSRNYPAVARMARDALAMPTCSKLCSDQIAQVRSIIRGYSKQPYTRTFGRLSSSSS